MADDLNKILARNLAYSKPAESYLTQLPPKKEAQFQQWVKENKVTFDPSPQADYDMRGFYTAMEAGNPIATNSINPNDGRIHYPDYWKTPYHKSFSAESQWAAPGAPSWNNLDQLVTPDGNIVFDERAQNVQ